MNWSRLQKQSRRKYLRRIAHKRERLSLAGAIRLLFGFAALISTIVYIANTDFRSPVVSRYAEWDDAYRRQDASTMVGILASDFHLDMHKGRRLTRSEYVQDLAKNHPQRNYFTRIREVEDRGQYLTVFIDIASSTQDGKLHRLRYRDLWTARSGRWLLTERSRSWGTPRHD